MKALEEIAYAAGRHALADQKALREANAGRVTWMSRLSAMLAALLVAETLCWLVGLGVNS